MVTGEMVVTGNEEIREWQHVLDDRVKIYTAYKRTLPGGTGRDRITSLPPLFVVSPLSSSFRQSLSYLDILPLPPPLRQCILPPKLTRRLAVHHPVPPVMRNGTIERANEGVRCVSIYRESLKVWRYAVNFINTLIRENLVESY